MKQDSQCGKAEEKGRDQPGAHSRLHFGEKPEQAGHGDENSGQEERGEFEDLDCGAEGAADAVGPGEISAAEELHDRSRDVAGQFGSGPDAQGGRNGKFVAKPSENGSPDQAAETEKEKCEDQSGEDKAKRVDLISSASGRLNLRAIV